MSDDLSTSAAPQPEGQASAPREPNSISQVAILAIVLLVGILALTAVVFVARDRLKSTIATDSQDMTTTSLGLTPQGFLGSNAPGAPGAGAVAQIAANLMSRAFSFTPKGFDAEVATAKKSMAPSMQQRYAAQLAQQSTRVLVTGGMTVTTSLVHYKGVAKNYAYLGVVSLTQTSGEFLMLFQRATTTAGSTQAQVTPFMLDVTVAKIGNTWILSDVQGI